MFRIAIIASSERLAVVHLWHVNPAFQSPLSSYVVRDQILNRILDSQLRGVPLKAVRLVVEDADESALFPIEIDLQDYIERGNPHEATPVVTGRGRFTQRFKIRSELVLAGLTRVHTSHSKPVAVPRDIARALR
ncbi:hypothetical protein [Paraburkholderia caribensis]|uniref:hypothetical protein n=1 Tax=Paraburkholderia caribensis TaxID=75105 RepID=UPI0034D1C0FA